MSGHGMLLASLSGRSQSSCPSRAHCPLAFYKKGALPDTLASPCPATGLSISTPSQSVLLSPGATQWPGRKAAGALPKHCPRVLAVYSPLTALQHSLNLHSETVETPSIRSSHMSMHAQTPLSQLPLSQPSPTTPYGQLSPSRT